MLRDVMSDLQAVLTMTNVPLVSELDNFQNLPNSNACLQARCQEYDLVVVHFV